MLRAVAKNEAKNVRKTTGVSEPENMMMASGTQARIGIGRRSSKTGKTYSLNDFDQPRRRPTGTPSAVASAKAMAIRRTLVRM